MNLDSGLKKYLLNTNWLFLEKFFRMFINLFVGIWVARYLGPENFGYLNYAQSFIIILSIFTMLGFDNIVVREITKDLHNNQTIVSTTITLKIIASIVFCLMFFISFKAFSNDEIEISLIGILIFIPIIQSFNIIDFYFQSRVLSKYVVIANSIALIFSSSFKIYFILGSYDLIYFAIPLLLEVVFISIGYIYFYKSIEKSFKYKFNLSLAFKILKSSIPLMSSGLVMVLYTRIDQIMIQNIMDSKDVGLYAAAIRICEILMFLPLVVTSSLFPALINAKKIDKKIYYERLQKLYDFMVISSLIVAIFVSISSNTIVAFLYGEAYSSASIILQIYVWGGIFTALLVSSGKWLVNENLVMHALYRNVLGLVSNVILNLLLIKKYGIEGAAYASVISIIISGYLFDLFNKKTIENFKMKTNSLNLFSYTNRYKTR